MKVDSYFDDGYLVVEGFASKEACRRLRERAAELVASFCAEPPAAKSIFSTKEQTRTSDDYFLESGGEIRFFFEEDGTHLNKIGHALHDRDAVFSAFSRDSRLKELAVGLGLHQPLLLQSMYIFKGPRVGGEVTNHQDSTFLWTDPPTCTGFWFALEDATVENGCLWAVKGGHRFGVHKRFVRAAGGGTRFELVESDPLPELPLVPLEAPEGTLVVLHGALPHLSGPNESDQGREAYSVHVIDGTASYPDENWLQRPADMPLRGFDQ